MEHRKGQQANCPEGVGTILNVRRVQGEWWFILRLDDGWFIDPDDHETRRHDPKRIKNSEWHPEGSISFLE